MLRQSFGSVEVTWLDREAVLRAVTCAVKRLVAARPEVRRVILFGSMARGDAVPGSDVDLLVVLAGSDRPFLDRIPLYKPSGIPVGVDVFPYTQEEMRRLGDEGRRFLRSAMREGMVLFDRRSD
jgi:predicted nucleotidyltransferase